MEVRLFNCNNRGWSQYMAQLKFLVVWPVNRNFQGPRVSTTNSCIKISNLGTKRTLETAPWTLYSLPFYRFWYHCLQNNVAPQLTRLLQVNATWIFKVLGSWVRTVSWTFEDIHSQSNLRRAGLFQMANSSCCKCVQFCRETCSCIKTHFLWDFLAT